MSIMDSEGLSTGEMVGLTETIDDRDALGKWMKQPRNLGGGAHCIMAKMPVTNNIIHLLPIEVYSCPMTGIVVLGLVLVAITVVFFGCYLLLRFMHRALSSDDRKHSNPSPYSNVVIHSKRVYEIQAEEGCFSGPPDIHVVEENSKSENSEEQQSARSTPTNSPRSSMKRPERGDLKTIRQETYDPDNPKQLMRQKERKVHKDSVCAFFFKTEQPEPKMI
ncbi:unnamed protein product [Cylicocyclus nassatus]|uniref:Uncharacterized protein n=1 Tax=Cylicocyclus nassatus TaxID=53992 RepID=A0AA36GJV6_CYLNA|nr:unnamed protein product [Cylicocyclus nassatus]